MKGIAVLSFADHVQQLLVGYIRDELKQLAAAEWYREWWTGDCCKYCRAHAGYAGSNNNIGVEVDWRDIKKLLIA